MSLVAGSVLPSHVLRKALLAVAGAVTFSLLSCRDSAGPGGERTATFAIRPVIETGVAGIVPLARARVVLTRTSNEVAYDNLFDIPPGADSLTLTLEVPVFSPDEVFTLTVAFIDTAGDTAFRGGPVEVTASSGSGSGGSGSTSTPIDLPITYTGVGVDAVAVEIEPPIGAILFGDTVPVQAVARRADGTAIPGTPIAWRSLDETRATFRAPSNGPPQYAGDVIAQLQRGDARLVAQLLTGPADTASLLVQPVPSAIATVAGTSQSGVVATTLPQSLVARVTAADAVGVEGVWVRFIPTSGTVSPDSALTDATGSAGGTWTLGTVSGAQSTAATVARLTGQSATFPATVLPGPPAAVTVTPPTATLAALGLTQQFQAAVADQYANAITNPSVTWTSSALGVATVDLTGLATAISNGTATITATSGAATGTATLSVAQGVASISVTPSAPPALTALGTTLQLTAEARDAGGNPVAVTFTWSSSAPGVATVSPTGGLVTAVANGSATIGATAGGVTGNVTVTVAQVVTSVVVTPAAPTLASLGATVQFAAAALDANGNPVSGPTFAWTTSDAAVATVDAVTGLATAVSIGSVTISATTGSVSGNTTLTVAPAAAQLAFTVEPSAVIAGVAIAPVVQVAARDANGNLVPTFTGNVALGISVNPASGTLSGTTTVAALGGVATFPDLSIDNAGTGYQLQATSPGLTPATSVAFDVTSAGAPGVAWINPSGGNWSVGTNWSTGSPPASTDTVVIALAGTYTVVLDINATVARLTVGDGSTGTSPVLQIASGDTLTVSGSASVEANASVTLAGAIAGGGTFLVNGAMTWAGGGIGGTGITRIGPAGTLNITGTSMALTGPRVLENQGAITWSGAGTLAATNGATVTNTATGTVTLTGNVFLSSSGLISTINNAGTWVSASPGTATIAPRFNNTGVANVQSGTLVLGNDGSSTGSFTTAAGATLWFGGGGHVLQAGSSVTGAGNVTLNTNPITISGTFDVGGLVSLNGGVANFNAAAPDTSFATDLQLNAGTLGGTGVLAVRDTLRWSATTQTGTGTTTILSTGTTVIFGGGAKNLTGGRTFEHRGGGGDWSAGTILGGGSSVFRNLGTLSVTAATTYDTIPGSPTHQFQNSGTLVRQTSTGVATIRVPVTNTGVIDVQSGTLAFANTFAHQDGAVLRGTGTVDLTAASVSVFDGDVNPGTSPGILAVIGALPLTSASTVNIELTGLTAGTQYDRLNVTGLLTQAGTLDVTLTGFTPAAGDQFAILTYGSQTGSFATVNLPSVGGLAFGTATSTGQTPDTLYVTVSAAGGSTVSWINAAGGNWSDGANWSTGVAPTASDLVAIDLAGTYTVTLDVNATVAGLQIGGASGVQTLTAVSRTLTVNGPTSIGALGAVLLQISSLAGSGVFTNAGTLTMAGGDLGANGSFVNQGLVVAQGTSQILRPSVTFAAGGTVRVQGNAAFAAGSLALTSGTTNAGVIELTSADAGYAATVSGSLAGILVNLAGGEIRSLAGAGGARSISAQVDNQGSITVSAALSFVRASSDHVNSGTIDLTNGNLTVTQAATTPSFTNTGAITIGSGRTWTVNGGTLDLALGTVSGAGRLTIFGATLAFDPGTLTLPLTLTTTTIAGGAVTIGTGETLTLLDGGLSDPVTVESGGVLLIHGAVGLTGALSLPAGSTLRVQGDNSGGTAALTVADGFTNDGAIELTSIDAGYTATLTVTNGTLVNAPTRTLRALLGTGGGGGRTLAAQLDNQGILDVEQPLTLSRADADHTNSGTIDLTAANLTLTQSGTTPSFTNTTTGTVTLGASRTWTVTGGLLDVTTGTVSGLAGARLAMTGGTLAFDPGTFTLPLTLTTTTIAGGAVTIGTGETLTLLNGGLSDPVTVESGGVLLIHGAVGLTGALSLPAGSTLRVQGDNSGGTAALTVANGFTNDGAIELTSIDAGYAASLTVTAGTLVNAPTRTLSALVGTGGGGSRTLAAQLDNQGILDVEQPLTLSRADADHTNSGTIDLTGGNLTLTQTGTTPSFTNTGTITVPGSRTFTAGAGVFTNGVGGIVQGSGTFNAAGTTFTNDGIFSPGGASTAGILTFTGNYTQTATGTLNIELGGPTVGTGYDQLAISGTATLGGTLNVTLINAFTPLPASTFIAQTFSGTPADFPTKSLPGTCTGAPAAGQYVISCP